jgi:pimeloyl-ACP methyl ester carboxylesterase
MASSSISWTGTNAFTIIGYSLGGGIAASFTSTFPSLVNSLVLIAPSGLLREKHIAWQSWLLYRTEDILPERLVRYLVTRRLDSPILPDYRNLHDIKPEDALYAEIGELKGRPQDISRVIDAAVQWQLENHAGFLDAFISSIRHAPITNQHQSWAKIGARLNMQKTHPHDSALQAEGMIGAKVILVLGKTDTIIIQAEIEDDAKNVLGSDNVEVMVFDVGHDIPICLPDELAGALWNFWAGYS